MRVRASIVGCAVLALLAGACSSSGSEPSPSATASVTPPTASPTASPTSSGPISNPAVDMNQGRTRFRVTGEVKEDVDLPLGPDAVYSPPPGQIGLVWLDRDGNALIISGPSFSGDRRTSTDLTLTIVVQRGNALAFTSAQGECTVTTTGATDGGVEGRFVCKKLSRGGKTVNVDGTFSASR